MRECTTHHHACDCREANFKEMEAHMERMIAALKTAEIWMPKSSIRAEVFKCITIAEEFTKDK